MKLPLAVSAFACLAVVGCGNHSASSGTDSSDKSKSASKPSLTKLETTDVKVGTGAVAEEGDSLYVEYKGTLADGSQFDSNMREDGQDATKPPFSFTISKANPQVIKGWNEGMVGMKVGGERKLSIPYSLGYGDAGSPPKIPPQADLYFDVKLLGIVKKDRGREFDFTDVKKGTGAEVKKGDWVTITFTAEHLNGLAVASSKDDGKAVQFQAGTTNAGEGKLMLVSGLSFGVIGMKVGGERTLLLPPQLATNPLQKVPVPQNSLLKFDVKVLRSASSMQPEMKDPDANKK